MFDDVKQRYNPHKEYTNDAEKIEALKEEIKCLNESIDMFKNLISTKDRDMVFMNYLLTKHLPDYAGSTFEHQTFYNGILTYGIGMTEEESQQIYSELEEREKAELQSATDEFVHTHEF